MGKLYLPKETKGFYDRAAKSLTVFVGERAFVGFTGTASEIAAVRFSAAGYDWNDRFVGTYREGPTALTAEIDTSSPARLTFQSQDDDGKDLAPPIEILVRMRPQYDMQMFPEGQVDATACWAACLTWWLSVTPGRKTVEQLDLLAKAANIVNADGTINSGPLTNFVQHSGFNMRVERIVPHNLPDYLGYWPLMIAFKSPGGFGHMNVLYAQDSSASTVDAMEPWSPDPAQDPNYTFDMADGKIPLFYSIADGSPFPFQGGYATRPYSYYGNNPMKGGHFLVGYPAEYRVQI